MMKSIIKHYHWSSYTKENMARMNSSCLTFTTEVKVWALETLVPESFDNTFTSITGDTPMDFTLAIARWCCGGRLSLCLGYSTSHLDDKAEWFVLLTLDKHECSHQLIITGNGNLVTFLIFIKIKMCYITIKVE